MEKVWSMFRSKNGKSTWLVRDAEVIVCHHDGKGIEDRKAFHLADKTTVILKGYWFSNPQSLFEDTGIHYLDAERGTRCV